MSDQSENFQFHRERKRVSKDKIEEIQAWITNVCNTEKSSWAFVYLDGKREITCVSGSNPYHSESPDRLSLIPVIEFLEWILNDKKRSVTIHTNSSYLTNLLNEWIDKWKKSQFKLSDGEDRPNADLLRRIDALKTPNITLIMKNLFVDNEFTEKVEELCRTELNLS